MSDDNIVPPGLVEMLQQNGVIYGPILELTFDPRTGNWGKRVVETDPRTGEPLVDEPTIVESH